MIHHMASILVGCAGWSIPRHDMSDGDPPEASPFTHQRMTPAWKFSKFNYNRDLHETGQRLTAVPSKRLVYAQAD